MREAKLANEVRCLLRGIVVRCADVCSLKANFLALGLFSYSEYEF